MTRILSSPALYAYAAAAAVWAVTVLGLGANGPALLSAALAFSALSDRLRV